MSSFAAYAATPKTRPAAQLYRRYCVSCHGNDGRAKTSKGKFSHARDLADAQWQTEVSDERIFNIGSGEGRSVRDVLAAIERALDRKLDIEWKHGRAADVPASVVAIERARDLLGWTPKTPFDRGLSETIRWWQSGEAER